MALAELLIGVIVAVLLILVVVRSVRVVPQARARNVERLGRYRKTLQPGMNFIIPFVDRVKPLIDLREQVVSFKGAPVITEDNLVVLIDTVLFFQVTDPRAADYEIVNYIQAIEQLTATMLRSVIGSMDLEATLTSRDKINNMLRGVLDDASGKWGIRVTRVEIKAIDPPKTIVDAMEKQMRAEREKRAAILTAEGVKQAKILTAEGDKQSNILTAEGERQSAILRSEGQAQAIGTVFQAVHRNDPDPKLLAWQYLQTLPQLAQGPGSTFWVIPSEVTSALKSITSAFDGRNGTDSSGASRAAPAAGASGDDSRMVPADPTPPGGALGPGGPAALGRPGGRPDRRRTRPGWARQRCGLAGRRGHGAEATGGDDSRRDDSQGNDSRRDDGPSATGWEAAARRRPARQRTAGATADTSAGNWPEAPARRPAPALDVIPQPGRWRRTRPCQRSFRRSSPYPGPAGGVTPRSQRPCGQEASASQMRAAIRANASTIMTVAMIVRPERLPGAAAASAECSGPVVFCAAGARSSRPVGSAPLVPPRPFRRSAAGDRPGTGRRKAGAPRWGPPRWGRAPPEAGRGEARRRCRGRKTSRPGRRRDSAGGPGTREKPEVLDGGACEKPPGAPGETGADGAACPA